ncbi:uncharacterized protein HMPREF1120_07646 [Exophiala dermatitidis NIH/UT8656]|uniref:Uncharacterized protein n=1 Tax=Exophiala dermatitidis (strain ATCC 34100 / CBS 525.76 / NIH/UT8656) TaxID=858893 RepID=H6C7G5_EXODN|nr:uncharacterized protein HMPREF1120_07646 [Exophiala dermatitidis NIH/UT8656]EHY59661.1 hypothetical protein HMPREF1120_07646 [Exophiala dermatitidis NIH/UT8656]
MYSFSVKSTMFEGNNHNVSDTVRHSFVLLLLLGITTLSLAAYTPPEVHRRSWGRSRSSRVSRESRSPRPYYFSSFTVLCLLFAGKKLTSGALLGPSARPLSRHPRFNTRHDFNLDTVVKTKIAPYHNRTSQDIVEVLLVG